MLTGLSIRDVVLIEALDLSFADKLGALTGETGAGKSILLDALGLALGVRADSGLVRQGAERAVVSASFELPASHPVGALLTESGLDAEPGEPLIVRRIVKADGGSRASVNDQPVSATLLREIGDLLVEVHGQHDDRGLLNAKGHRALLDAFGGIDIRPLTSAWADWQAAVETLDAARAEAEEAARDREFLDHAVGELEAIGPEPGEEAELAEQRATMQKGDRISGDLQEISELLDGSEGGLARLRQAARRADRIAGEHALLAEALAALDRALIEADLAEEKLAEAAHLLAFDPKRLDEVETRLFEIRALARKHRVEPDELPRLAEELAAKLERIEGGEAHLAALEQEVAAKREAYETEAEKVGKARAKAAKALDKAVAGELGPLKLDAAQFRTAIEPLEEAQWGAAGRERVAFEISTNPGAPFGPLAKIASGGELSRFILALKVALAEQGEAVTMVFDEIDRGVGGAVASAVGDRLARLAESAQILVVTHSPQVAARARRQWLIAKTSDGFVTRTSVHQLDEGERREEIARMLSGAEITDEARAQADRLLEGV
ncbi:MAG: DNA repair protein RecN [Parasphingopyxis sp.]